jgi:hypothetical protein
LKLRGDIRSSDVSREDHIQTLADLDHMSGVLTGAEEPIHPICAGVISSDNLISLGREVQFAAGEGQAVRAAQDTQVDDGNGVAGRVSATVSCGESPVRMVATTRFDAGSTIASDPSLFTTNGAGDGVSATESTGSERS